MHTLWLVARQEYRRMVFRRGFLLATLAVPLGLLAVVGLGFLIERSRQNSEPVGYVDGSDKLDAALLETGTSQSRVPILAYPDQETALAALQRGEIQAFFVIPSTYPATLNTELYTSQGTLGSDAWGDFDQFVRESLVAGLPADTQQRLLAGPSITVHDISNDREFNKDAIVSILLPILGGVFFMFAISMASGYMVQIVTDEKESRTMEVLLTSLTPGQLLGGKSLGLLAAALTQLAVYGIAAVIGLTLAANYVPQLRQVTAPWGYLGAMTLLFLPAYALAAAISIAIGSAVTEVQQGQQLSGLVGLTFLLPLFLAPMIFQNPSHPLVVFFSLFPTTSFLAISMRWGLGSVPMWQVAVGWTLLVASAALTLWAAVRIFRVGMLQYGQPLTLKRLLSAVKRG